MSRWAITPEHNVEAIIERNGERIAIARHCERCGSAHDGAGMDDSGGARYLVRGLWLCVECMLK